MKKERLPPAERVIAWQKESGRNGLPWQDSADPYVRWLSEIMLQQTQVTTVIPYFERFMERFPTVADLTAASEEEVLELWAGLGYYSRAVNLHRCARQVTEEFGGVFPSDVDDLVKLCGIGRSTAGAIRSAVTDIPAPILDGNVKRVLSRYRAIGREGSEAEFIKRLWQEAESILPEKEGRTYAQGMMDLGATVCTRNKPLCIFCPLSDDCRAFLTGTQANYPPKKVKGSSPEEDLFFRVLIKDETVFLQKRRARFWKNLWVPPRFEEKSDDLLPESRMVHKLTHLTLNLYFFLDDARTESGARGCSDNTEEGRWFSAEEIENGAIPTPVKKKLLSMLRPS